MRRLFVEAYAGDTVEAMRIAGYIGDNAHLKAHGESILREPEIIAAINDRSKYETKTIRVIADRQERQTFWSKIMQNEDPYEKPVLKDGIPEPSAPLPLQLRLKASEMLGKSEADFMDRLDVSGSLTVTDIITQAYEVPFAEVEEVEYQKAEAKSITPPSPSPKPQADDLI